MPVPFSGALKQAHVCQAPRPAAAFNGTKPHSCCVHFHNGLFLIELPPRAEPFPLPPAAVCCRGNAEPSRFGPDAVLLSPHGHELVDGHEAGPVASSQAEQRRLPVQRALAGLGRETKGTESMGSVCGELWMAEVEVRNAAGVVQRSRLLTLCKFKTKHCHFGF